MVVLKFSLRVTTKSEKNDIPNIQGCSMEYNANFHFCDRHCYITDGDLNVGIAI